MEGSILGDKLMGLCPPIKEHIRVPIPGTTNLQHLQDNFNAATIVLPADVLTRMNSDFSPEAVAGPRYSKPAQDSVTTEKFDFEAA